MNNENTIPECPSDADEVLYKQGRKRFSIMGDGNCMFRAFAFLACGSESTHLKIRLLLVKFISLNTPLFSPLLFGGTIDKHVKQMQHIGKWGTQVELQAATSFFQKPLYVLTKGTNDKAEYKWIMYKPHPLKVLTFPDEMEINFLNVFNTTLKHLEICHVNGSHYDCVVDQNDKVPLQSPALSEKHLYVDEVLGIDL